MDYILRDIDIELRSKVRAKATSERKTIREVIFESLQWYMTPVETTASADKKEKRGKSKIKEKVKTDVGCGYELDNALLKVSF